MSELDWSRWPDFKRHEFACKCGCDRAEMDPAFMDWLQGLRTALGKPMIPTSGYRCPDHNAAVSTSGRDGPHVRGVAVDIKAAGPYAHELLRLAMARGVRGVGSGQGRPWDKRFLHLDLMDPDRPTIWGYGS